MNFIKYNVYFIDQMIAVITSSIVVVYMLYTVDARTIGEFGSKYLMLSIPFVYYGVFRYLYLIHVRGEGGAPDEIALRDRPLQLTVLLFAATIFYALYLSA